MTTETHTRIEPKDIRTIEIECQRCGTRIACPVDRQDRIPPQCPNCYESWFAQHRDGNYPAIDAIRAITTSLVALRSGHVGLLANLRFDITA